ncbi:MAG TPA: hypothetical protein VHF89_14695, partial [Solirubrobacteraceae bacterium]|nr:hypothetical protein [Solirubrobacteraceae bacterium]
MTAAPGRLVAALGSPEREIAELVAWLWRLGPVLDEPAPDAVAVGGPERAAELRARVRERRLAGAIVLAAGDAPQGDGLPARRVVEGVARFGRGLRAEGAHTVLAEGTAAVRSSLGVHATRDERVLLAGASAAGWGDLATWWLLPALADFLPGVLDRPLVALPPVGCLRLDDAPGTAELQLLGRAKPDDRERRRLDAMLRALERSGSVLVAAVAARALRDGEIVPIEEVWPGSMELLARGVERGLLEPACHGLLHLDPREHAAGRVEPREFARLDREEAGRRLDEALEWIGRRLGPARSFIAPAWGYSEGTLEAAGERGLTTWMPPRPGPLLDAHLLHETLHDGVPGLTGLSYGPLERLAAVGVPPTVVFHGRLLDDRLPRLRAARDVLSLARLVRRRDLERVAELPDVRWVGAAELTDRLRAHAAGAGEAVLIDARPGRPRR